MRPHTYYLKHGLLTMLLGATLTACGSSAVPATALPSPSASAIPSAASPQASAAPSATMQTTATDVPTTSVATPSAEATATSESTATVAVDDSVAIAKTLLAYLKPTQQGKPVVVGATNVEDDYAAAIAQPQGERTIYAFLKRTASGWEVIEATSIPSKEILGQKGIPDRLLETSDASDIVATWAGQLQDPRGEGVEGSVVLEGIVGDYARGFFSPADPTTRDGFTAFFMRENESWKQVTGGTAFDSTTLQQLGIPQELWTGR